MHRLFWLAQAAVGDLESIHEYIARENPVAARSVIAGFHTKFEMLQEAPWLGIRRNELGEGVRMLVAGRYLIYYSLTESELIIRRVLHARRHRTGL